MKTIAYFLCFFLIASPVLAESFKKVIERTIPAVAFLKVKIETKVIDPATLEETTETVIQAGSAFLIEHNILVTNYHVIKSAKPGTIAVYFKDKYKKYIAKVLGWDEKLDIAVLKINRNKIVQTLKWADSTKIYQGQEVWAIGAPFFLPYSVTKGIISHTLRRGVYPSGPTDWQPSIQVDVVINTGNSGGPLLNMAGYVLGVNTQILTMNGAPIGINFATISNLVKKAVNQIIATGEFHRPLIGVIMEDDRTQHWVKIIQVFEDTPAHGKLFVNDILHTVNGVRIREMKHLFGVLEEISPGDILNFLITRNEKFVRFTLRTGAETDQSN